MFVVGRQWWMPDTGGTNIPALNDLMAPWDMAFRYISSLSVRGIQCPPFCWATPLPRWPFGCRVILASHILHFMFSVMKYMKATLALGIMKVSVLTTVVPSNKGGQGLNFYHIVEVFYLDHSDITTGIWHHHRKSVETWQETKKPVDFVECVCVCVHVCVCVCACKIFLFEKLPTIYLKSKLALEYVWFMVSLLLSVDTCRQEGFFRMDEMCIAWWCSRQW